MKKTYKLIDLDCANCAAKMEERIKKLEGVTDATVSFMTQRMTVVTESDDQIEIMKEIVRVIRKVEPDCTVVL
ncbi:MAG: heavy-metal-associated domain-containing protein [Clostridia bacterium]|nr:heavy-metal-associated domain-containing protein [Clostridia bacterium]